MEYDVEADINAKPKARGRANPPKAKQSSAMAKAPPKASAPIQNPSGDPAPLPNKDAVPVKDQTWPMDPTVKQDVPLYNIDALTAKYPVDTLKVSNNYANLNVNQIQYHEDYDEEGNLNLNAVKKVSKNDIRSGRMNKSAEAGADLMSKKRTRLASDAFTKESASKTQVVEKEAKQKSGSMEVDDGQTADQAAKLLEPADKIYMNLGPREEEDPERLITRPDVLRSGLFKLKDHIVKLNNERDDLTEKYTKAVKEKDELAKTYKEKDFETKFNESSAKASLIEKLLEEKTAQHEEALKRLTADLAFKESELGKAKEDAERLNSIEMVDQNQVESTLRAEYAEKIAGFEKDISDSKSKLTEFEAKNKKHLEDYEALKKSNQELSDKNTTYERQLTTLKENLNDMENNLADYKKTKNEKEGTIKERDTTIKALETQIKTLQEKINNPEEPPDLKKVKAQLVQLEEAVESYKTQVSQFEPTKNQFAREKESLRKEVEAVTSDWNLAKEDVKKLTSQISSLKDDLEASNKKYSSLQEKEALKTADDLVPIVETAMDELLKGMIQKRNGSSLNDLVKSKVQEKYSMSDVELQKYSKVLETMTGRMVSSKVITEMASELQGMQNKGGVIKILAYAGIATAGVGAVIAAIVTAFSFVAKLLAGKQKALAAAPLAAIPVLADAAADEEPKSKRQKLQ